MNDREALFRAVLASPGDDLPRLVLADFLDENGEPERAEFIRVQCELAAWQPCTLQSFTTQAAKEEKAKWGKLHWGKLRANASKRAEQIGRRRLSEHEGRKYALQQRARELLTTNAPRWKPAGFLAVTDANYFGRLDSHRVLVYRRGFVAGVHGPLATFWADRVCDNCEGEGRVEDGFRDNSYGPCPDCGGQFEPRDDEFDPGYSPGTGRVSVPVPAFAATIAREPVEAIEVTDRQPGQYGNTREWYWSEWTPEVTYQVSSLPPELFRRLAGETQVSQFGSRTKHYPTRAAAVAALSAALLAWAKDAARHAATASLR